ncbi:MAG: SDR family oxidoreductase [Chitinophagaceae bacterium]|nr:SDR family oxidoreductase [Chitinophagaceae bacterium]
MQRLKGQTALVTGGNSGIGKGIVEAFAREGANVVINYVVHDEVTTQMVQQITVNGGNAIGFKADVSNEAEVQEMFRQAIAHYGTIDILVNNAGLQRDAPFTEMTIAQWQTVMNVNLTGYFLCAREAAKEFIHRGVVPERSSAAGKIICISSVHEMIPWAGHADYASSKGGISMFMKTIAQELASQKIRVNGIAPGAIQTPINKSDWDNEASLKKLLTLIPYGRIGQPEDIGKAAVWLASDESDYVTGATLFVDGGMTLFPGFIANG